MTDLAPPQDLDAERSVLAAMLLDEAAIGRAVELLDASAFYRTAHARLFEALVALHGRGVPADLITVAEELKQRGDLEAVGGLDFLAGIMESATTAANLGHHAQIVRGKATLRQLINATGEIQQQCYSGFEPAAQVLERAESRILGIVEHGARATVSLSEAARRFAETPARAEERPLPILGDGVICAGDLALLAGKPGLGKSRLAIELSAACQGGGPWLELSTARTRAGYLAAEFTRFRWWRRCVRLFGDGMASEDPAQLKAAYERIIPEGLMVVTRDQVDDLPDLSTDGGATALERVIAEHGLGLLTIDPLSRFLGDNEETPETFGRLVQRLDRVRVRTGCALLVVHHERKGSTEGTKDDDLDAVRGGGGLVAAAPTVLRLVAGHGEVRELRFPKTNHCEKPANIWHRIPEGGGRTVVELAPDGKAEGNRDQVRRWLEGQAIAVSAGRIAEGTGLSLRTCKTHLYSLADAGLVERQGLNADARWRAPGSAPGPSNGALDGWDVLPT